MSVAGTSYKVQLNNSLISLCLSDVIHCAAGGDKRCPYLPKPDAVEDSRLYDFRDQILVRILLVLVYISHPHWRPKASPKDIEDLIITGKASQTCPYFASREAISQAEVRTYIFFVVAQVTRRRVLQVVTLPYNLLLHRDAREALGIDLINQVVVVDEAHSEYFTMTPRKLLRFCKISYRLYFRYPL